MVPLGVAVAEPVTVTATETGVLSTIELLAGDTLTWALSWRESSSSAPPLPPLLPLLLGDDEPQPTAAKPMAGHQHASSQHMLSTSRVRARDKEDQERQHCEPPPAVLNHFDLSKGAG